MFKAVKSTVAVLLLIALLVFITHGLVVPRFIWEPRLQSIQNQYPDQKIAAKRVVFALSLNPQLMISEIEIDDPTRGENVKVGLLRFAVEAVDSMQQGRLQISSITLKGLVIKAEKKGNCSTFNLECMPVLPLALAARGWQSTQAANPSFFTPQLALNELGLEQALFAVTNTEAQQQLTGKIEQFKFQLGNSPEENQLSLGWRLNVKTPETDNELYVAMNAQPEIGPVREVALKKLKMDVDGRWGGFPWTATAEQNLLVLRLLQANNGEGAPFIKLNGDNLRTYIRRDDLPETHQAAFSVQQFEGGLPAQDWILEKAEWTYTHEDAQAWTFNMNYHALNSQLSISPETIEGSEGLPAEPQVLEVGCPVDGNPTRELKPYWAWQKGWFRVLSKHPGENASLVLCPVQQPSAGKGFTVEPGLTAGK